MRVERMDYLYSPTDTCNVSFLTFIRPFIPHSKPNLYLHGVGVVVICIFRSKTTSVS